MSLRGRTGMSHEETLATDSPRSLTVGRHSSRRRLWRLSLALLLALALVAFILALAGGSYWDLLLRELGSAPTSVPTEASIPPGLGGLKLVETVTGKEGLAQVNRMHGKDIELARGFSALYGGNGTAATLWVGWAETEASAQDLTDRMTAKIGPEHHIFQDLSVLAVGGRSVFATTGLGQQHYYFRSGTAVVWVAVDGIAAQRVVHDALTQFP